MRSIYYIVIVAAIFVTGTSAKAENIGGTISPGLACAHLGQGTPAWGLCMIAEQKREAGTKGVVNVAPPETH